MISLKPGLAHVETKESIWLCSESDEDTNVQFANPFEMPRFHAYIMNLGGLQVYVY